VADPYPPQNNQQYFNFESSSYGYGFRNWAGEQHVYNNQNLPQLSHAEIIHQQEMERQRQSVEKAKSELLARFPFYAINMHNQGASQSSEMLSPDQIPMPVEAPRPVEAPQYSAPAYFPGTF
jgi:hypothetical protein